MKHILFKLEGCPFPTLNDEEHIKFCLFNAAQESHSKVLKIETQKFVPQGVTGFACLLYTSPSPRDKRQSRMPSSA